MAPVSLPKLQNRYLGISVWRLEQRLSEAWNQIVWLRRLLKPSSVTMSALIQTRTQKALSNHCICGSSITMISTHISV